MPFTSLDRPIDVLVVEDNPGDAVLTSDMLERATDAQFRTQVVATLGAAEAAVDGADVVLLDLDLPDSRGLETLLRLHGTAPDVPVVVLTSLEDEAVALKALECGAQDYLVKGQVSPQTLLRALQHAIGRFEMVKDLELALQTVQSREASFRNLISGTADGMVVTDPDGRVLFVNPAAEALLGRRADQLVGELADLPSGVGEPQELVAEGPLGDRRVLEVRAVDVVWDGRPARMLSLYDLSERRRAEDSLRASAERLRQAERLDTVGRLAGSLAHDFNNLLTVITGYSSFLLDDIDEGDDHYEHVRAIQGAAARAEQIVDQLLAFGGRKLLRPELLDPNRVVQTVSRRVARRMSAAGVSVATVLDPAPGRVRADLGQFVAVLTTLLEHAAAQAGQGGRVTLATANVHLEDGEAREFSLGRTGPFVLVMVSDTGAGLSEDDRQRLFDPFHSSSELRRQPGIELAAVYGIVKQEGGTLAVSSAEGQGTTVKLYLPRVDAEPLTGPPSVPATALAARPSEELPHGDEVVLVVDDVEPVRTVVGRLLRHCGYRVLEAGSPAQALETCRSHDGPIDLLVTDVVMPGLSGHELAQLVRGHQPSMRVLFMSGFTDDAALRRAVLHRGEPFLQKPFTPQRLARKVRDVLDGRGAPPDED
jgi:two-component system, cell cycle sensor histidine kinase and response regulator CckA